MDTELCAVDGCDNTRGRGAGNGMCSKHYMRLHRTGSTDTVRDMHGLSETPEYFVWGAMVQRCTNPNSKFYKFYGGRGIEVCERWLKFSSFLDDMGNRPINGTLDRQDNNGNYEPSNCRWVTQKVQSNNTRRNHWIEFEGESKTIAQWADLLNLKYTTLYARIKNMPLEKAMKGQYYGWTR